jgi:hypothetical protein
MASNGMKLKLLIALFTGRHCIANSNIIKGTSLAYICHAEDSAEGIIHKIHELMGQPFTSQMITERTDLLDVYSNRFNAKRILHLIFPD